MKLNLTNLFVALIVPVLMGGSLADASTFVGNGGNSANLDLALTLAEIRKTNELIFKIQNQQKDVLLKIVTNNMLLGCIG